MGRPPELGCCGAACGMRRRGAASAARGPQRAHLSVSENTAATRADDVLAPITSALRLLARFFNSCFCFRRSNLEAVCSRTILLLHAERASPMATPRLLSGAAAAARAYGRRAAHRTFAAAARSETMRAQALLLCTRTRRAQTGRYALGRAAKSAAPDSRNPRGHVSAHNATVGGPSAGEAACG